ncbi:MAG: hypothetical protein IPK15_22065 [Verrucomicrobia bacterium]|nr:hypothetical protein [Verrucomicrobiota bacterium]
MPPTPHQRAEYELQFRGKYRDDFQAWFAEVVRLLHPGGDLQRVRVTQGDGGLDCVSLNKQRVYQCYAPARTAAEMKDSETAAKIRKDFANALKTLGETMREWVFVHNHPQSELGQLSNAAMLEIKAQHLGLTILAWGATEFWNELAAQVPNLTLARAFGGADVSQMQILAVGLDDLLQVIARLEALPSPLQLKSPTMPDGRKLEFNSLTGNVQDCLLMGRRIEDKVERLFSRSQTDVERGERIAEGFRHHYGKLRDSGTEPNRIFDLLLEYSGWATQGTARSNTAVLGVLSYFFHRCDIFENPPE